MADVVMAQSQRRLASEGNSDAGHGKHPLNELDANRLAKRLVMFEPSPALIESLMEKARLAIPGLAATEEVLKVSRHNPLCMLAVARRSQFDPSCPAAEGFIATLPLNALGLQMLALGAFDATKPDLRLITPPHERPAGLYMWCMFTPGALAASAALYMARVASEQYAGISLYSRPNTDAGRRFNLALGFTPGTRIGEIDAPNVWIFSRERQRPLYDSYIPGRGKDSVGITVAHSFEDLMRVAAIRNAVYIGEQECPYDEEYDGNDLSATHLLAYIGDEPVGCLRLRFFADFAKFERMAIRKEFRKSRAAIQLARAGFKLCQKKGYTRVYGHIQERLVPFWSRFGFQVKPDTKTFTFSDYEYVEIIAHIERDPDAITLDADPYVLIRPEGRWHTPGILEKSPVRAASRHPERKKA